MRVDKCLLLRFETRLACAYLNLVDFIIVAVPVSFHICFIIILILIVSLINRQSSSYLGFILK